MKICKTLNATGINLDVNQNVVPIVFEQQQIQIGEAGIRNQEEKTTQKFL